MSLVNADILCRNCVCKKDEAANDTTEIKWVGLIQHRNVKQLSCVKSNNINTSFFCYIICTYYGFIQLIIK
ncbi:hypothetical protein CBQ28_00355 [Pseudoalteromonas sp. GCY]|nr:hypothetical protein CBQ28_00355 [Pseudoalteromonas sp. GCY]